MRVAVLSDIHGNLPALDAVLTDVWQAGPNLVVLNGDLADGPMPAQTLDRLAGLGDRAVWVRGHADRRLVDAFDGNFMIPGLDTDPAADWFEWCAARLNRYHRDLLRPPAAGHAGRGRARAGRVLPRDRARRR